MSEEIEKTIDDCLIELSEELSIDIQGLKNTNVITNEDRESYRLNKEQNLSVDEFLDLLGKMEPDE